MAESNKGKRKSREEIVEEMAALGKELVELKEEEERSLPGRSMPTHGEYKSLFQTQSGDLSNRIREVFAPYGESSAKKTKVKSTRKDADSNSTGAFLLKQVVLLPFANVQDAPTLKDMEILGKLELVAYSIDVGKSLSSTELKSFLRSQFSEQLKGMDFEILKKEGTCLLKPRLAQGASLNGYKASDIFSRCKMYLRPSIDLTVDAEQINRATPTADSSSRRRSTLFKSVKRKSFEISTDDDSDVVDSPKEVNTSDSVHASLPERQKVETDDCSLTETSSTPRTAQDISDEEYLEDVTRQLYEANETKETPTNKIDDEVMEVPIITINDEVEEIATIKILHNDFASVRASVRNNLKRASQSTLYINRGRVFHSIATALHRMKIDPGQEIYVKFYDEINMPEAAIDDNGPKKECLRLAFKEIHESYMLEGPYQQKNLTLCHDSLRNNYYKYFGILCAMALAYSEMPVPNFLSNEMYLNIVNGKYNRSLEMNSVIDIDIHNELIAIQNSTTPSELKSEVSKSVVAALMGVSSEKISFARKERLVKDCLQYYLIDRMKEAFQQFLEGLETLGVLTLIRNQPELLKDVFVHNGVKLTAEQLKSIFFVYYSDVDAMKKIQQDVLENFYLLLDDMEAGNCVCSLEDVLIFFTASDQIPLGGYMITPSIRFHTDPRLEYPRSSTCINEMTLPILTTDYEDMKNNICPYFKLTKNLDRA